MDAAADVGQDVVLDLESGRLPHVLDAMHQLAGEPLRLELGREREVHAHHDAGGPVHGHRHAGPLLDVHEHLAGLELEVADGRATVRAELGRYRGGVGVVERRADIPDPRTVLRSQGRVDWDAA